MAFHLFCTVDFCRCIRRFNKLLAVCLSKCQCALVQSEYSQGFSCVPFVPPVLFSKQTRCVFVTYIIICVIAFANSCFSCPCKIMIPSGVETMTSSDMTGLMKVCYRRPTLRRKTTPFSLV